MDSAQKRMDGYIQYQSHKCHPTCWGHDCQLHHRSRLDKLAQYFAKTWRCSNSYCLLGRYTASCQCGHRKCYLPPSTNCWYSDPPSHDLWIGRNLSLPHSLCRSDSRTMRKLEYFHYRPRCWRCTLDAVSTWRGLFSNCRPISNFGQRGSVCHRPPQ